MSSNQGVNTPAEELSEQEQENRILAQRARLNQGMVEDSPFYSDTFTFDELNAKPDPNEIPLPEDECPICHIGKLKKRFTWLGVVMGIALFPIGGMVCCFMTRISVCENCGSIID